MQSDVIKKLSEIMNMARTVLCINFLCKTYTLKGRKKNETNRIINIHRVVNRGSYAQFTLRLLFGNMILCNLRCEIEILYFKLQRTLPRVTWP